MKSTKVLLVLGGSSDIGRATALAFAEQGWTVQLAGRDKPGLEREASDVAARTGALVSAHSFDVLDTASFEPFIAGLQALPDCVVCVIGLLGEQTHAESHLDHAALVMRSNYEGPSLILSALANRFQVRGSGTIIGVSSVAGDRGRGSNYIYGSAKAGFTAFLSGLRNRLAMSGVHVVTVKPGFVRTKMTDGMKLPPVLTSEPQLVARAILKSEKKRTNVIYVSKIWRYIMLIISNIPEPFFKKMKL